jgi:hypothetical protein
MRGGQAPWAQEGVDGISFTVHPGVASGQRRRVPARSIRGAVSSALLEASGRPTELSGEEWSRCRDGWPSHAPMPEPDRPEARRDRGAVAGGAS